MSGFGPSSSFWSPNAFGSNSSPYSQTLKLARKLKSLTAHQRNVLRQAASRPWDAALQAWAQAALTEQESPLFESPPLETEESLAKTSRLADRFQLFIPTNVVIPPEATELLEKRFMFAGNTGSARVYLSDRLLSLHVLFTAQSGSGKTVRAQRMFLETRSQGRWAFLHSKAEEWYPIIRGVLDQGMTPAMPREWKINPVAPFGNPYKSKEHFTQLFAETEDLPTYSRDVLDMAVDSVYQRFGAFSNELPLRVNPTLADVIEEVRNIDPKTVSKTVTNTILIRLAGWQRQFGDWARPWDLEELARRTVIFPLSELNEKSARVFVERLQGPLFAIRETRPTKERTMLLHEEARLVYCGKSQMAEDIALLRAEGLWVCCLVQSTRDLNPVLLENTGVKVVGPVGHPSIAKQMSAAMDLRKEHLEALRQMPIGTFIDRYLYGFTNPLAVRAPFRQLRQPTAKEIHEAEHALDSMPTMTRKEAQRIEVDTDAQPTSDSASEIGAEDLEFLLGVHESPYLTVRERFQLHGLNPRKGTEIKTRCAAAGLVEEHRVPLGLGGAPVLLQLTGKGQALLGLPEINHQVVHSYGIHLVLEHCERHGATANPEVDGADVVADVGGRSVAIEVEWRGTNAEANLRRNVHHDLTVFVAIGAEKLKRLERKLRPVVRNLALSDRVIFTGLDRIVKSDRPIWQLGPKSADPVST